MLRTALVLGMALGGIAFGDFTDNEYQSGHADFAVGYEDPGEFFLHIHAEGAVINGVLVPDDEIELSDIYIRVPDTTIEPRPAGSNFDFIGIPAGQNYFRLPQSGAEAAIKNAPFFGIGTEELDPADWVGSINFSVTDFSGPGEFSLFAGFTPDVLVATFDGLPDAFDLPVGLHDHYNWAFTAPGVYLIEWTVTGTHVTDGLVQSVGIMAFAVGDSTVIPEPSTYAMLGLAAAVGVFLRRRQLRANSPATLAA